MDTLDSPVIRAARSVDKHAASIAETALNEIRDVRWNCRIKKEGKRELIEKDVAYRVYN